MSFASKLNILWDEAVTYYEHINWCDCVGLVFDVTAPFVTSRLNPDARVGGPHSGCGL